MQLSTWSNDDWRRPVFFPYCLSIIFHKIWPPKYVLSILSHYYYLIVNYRCCLQNLANLHHWLINMLTHLIDICRKTHHPTSKALGLLLKNSYKLSLYFDFKIFWKLHFYGENYFRNYLFIWHKISRNVIKIVLSYLYVSYG